MKFSLHTYFSTPSIPKHSPSVLTIGNFDGIHLGHYAVLKQVCEQGTRRGLTPTVMSFEPHPREYFASLRQQPQRAPARISNLRTKLMTLQHIGIEQTIIARFNVSWAQMSARNFIENLLIHQLHSQLIIVGKDFRFGHERAGDIDLLHTAGQAYGFEVQTLADTTDAQGHRISSSALRSALANGDIDQAKALLGRPYSLWGRVVHGRKLGRILNYPTLNLHVPANYAVHPGIYITRVHHLESEPLPAIASLGVRPTVENNGQLLLEAHVLDQYVEGYGKLIEVEFIKKLRNEQKFADFTVLKQAIARDAQQARDYFAATVKSS